MKDSLVALNIVSDDRLLTNTKVPILFYWDGESDVIDSILADANFQSLLKNVVMNSTAYSKAKIALFYFKYENDKETYADEELFIQNILKLKDLDEDTRMFYKEYLWIHFTYLYSTAYHEKYPNEFSLFNIDEYILDIYDKIQEKYPKRVIKSTVVNYIRSELQSKNHLSLENCDWIIFELEKLLTERD